MLFVDQHITINKFYFIAFKKYEKTASNLTLACIT
jgi:hypothetical protein